MYYIIQKVKGGGEGKDSHEILNGVIRKEFLLTFWKPCQSTLNLLLILDFVYNSTLSSRVRV